MKRNIEMTTLLERLRALAREYPTRPHYTEAADEIERLNTYLDGQVRYYNDRRQKDLAEIERLNKWADGFSDAQLKERQLCEARIQEIEQERKRLGDELFNLVCQILCQKTWPRCLVRHYGGRAMTEKAIEAAANAMLALERENDRPSHLDYASVAVAVALPSLIAEIKQLNAARLADSQRILKMSDEYEAAQDEIERLRRSNMREI